MSFIDEYKKIMKEGYHKVICSYNKITGRYEYKPFCHINSVQWKDEFINVLIDNLLNYCYEEKELEKLYNPDIPNLKRYINKAIKDRLNKKTKQAQKDGLCGELLIDLILRMENQDNKVLCCRPYYQQLGARSELKNYDVLMFRVNNDDLTLILGQVKTGSFDYCNKGIKEDLNTKYKDTYFGDAVCYIADRRISDDTSNEKLLKLVSDLNGISLDTDDINIRNDKICEYIKDNNIEIEIPCLLLYGNNSIYNSVNDISINLEKEVELVKKYFDNLSFNICDFNFRICFYVFPTKSIEELRNGIMEYKKEVICG